MAPPATSRQFYVDNLRNIAVLLLIVFHTGRLFDPSPWHMKNAYTYQLAGDVIDIIDQWHMPLFFLLTGMAAYYAINARGAGTFARDRIFRLFIPLGFGILVAALPQVYLERISPYVPNRQSPIDFNGSFFEFVPRFFEMVPYPGGDFSWHHLWFIGYLFVYSLVLAPVFALLSRPATATRVHALGAWLARGWRIVLIGLPVVVLGLLLYPSFPSTHGLIDDWAAHAHFLTVILVGWLIATTPALVQTAVRLRWAALALGVVSILITLPAPEWTIVSGPLAWYVNAAVYLSGQWLWLVAFIGLGSRLLDRRVPYLTAFTRYAFPFYIFHQAVIIWLGWLTFDWQSMPLVKYLAIGAASLVLSYLLARLFDLTPVTRFLIGLKSPSKPKPIAGAPAVRAA